MGAISIKTQLNDNDIKKSRFKITRHDIEAHFLLLPQIIGFFVFTLYPIIWAVKKSFYYYTGIDSATRFVGLENFKAMFTIDSRYWYALLNSFLFTLGKLPFEIPLALILAVIVSKKYKGFQSARILFYMPSVISVAVVGLIFSRMFAYYGYINSLFVNLEIFHVSKDFFATKGSAMFLVILASIWQTFGINTIYFLAAIQNIPQEVYESAKIDGSGTINTFFKITLPLIAPVFVTILLLALNGSLQTGDIILTLTNGGPSGQTEVVMTHLLKALVPGFTQSGSNVGYGCAMATVNAIIFSLVAIVYLKISKKMVRYY